MKNISYDQAMKLVKSDSYKLIDVQLKEEYEIKHLKNSFNIPVEIINEKFPAYFNKKNIKFIVYCLSGIRSVAACDMLQRLGYTNVYNIKEGIENQK